MRILIVEDSERLRKNISTALKRTGYAVDCAEDGETGTWYALNNDYDAIILDIMLPKRNGLEILDELNRKSRVTPVLLLTARDTVEDRVHGLDRGADDYLTKPFALEELLARVKVLCRRKYQARNPQFSIGNLTIETSAKSVHCEDREIQLKPREYAVLELLALRAGEVVSRSEIENHIYDDLADPMSNVVESAISILRKKMSESGVNARVTTRRGQGYLLQPPE